MTTDGHSQRNALTAAENAIKALAAGNAQRARKNASRAADLDQIGLFTDLPEAVAVAADHIDDGGQVTAADWDAVVAAVGPGPLAFLVADVRDD